MKYCLGIDPGQTGAIAWLSEDLQDYGALRWKDDIATTAKLVREQILDKDLLLVLAIIEKVHSMPKQGVVSAFSFGSNYGAWQAMMAMASVPYVLITPQKWQKAMWDSDRKGMGTKTLSTRLVARMFPNLDLTPGRVVEPHSGMADAMLMANYGVRMLRGRE